MHQANTSVQHPQLCTVTLLGNLVAKPDIRYRTNPVSAVTEIILATSTKWLDKKSNQYKEWTSYHPIKVEGDLVEQALLTADKGDIILVHGYLSNIKPSNTELQSHSAIVHANYIQKFKKGYTQTVNQIYCSGQIASTPQLIKTQNNKSLAQVNITINQRVYSIDKQCWQNILIEREMHVWGKQAEYMVDHALVGDSVMVEGKLSYLTSANKVQFIDAKTLHWLKS
ncbi:single-stranded DNA-binding protein [Candidatus Colwellia aromaticivorans]|uniref:single-stranded DNA-binding protein n=1 Tax=Candidatus Colwellia aromaticivorans TaxID=2267621 RepID=UPI000DF26BED|nr:single-stranded DNA-binding protein [Candidatus Colwellia aromaticivorans]